MRGAREVPCDGCRKVNTPGGRACSSECASLMKRRAARTCSTPETRAADDRWAGFGTRSELPTLDAVEPAPVDKHVAITKITDAIAAGFYTEERLQQLVDEAERLKLKGRAA